MEEITSTVLLLALLLVLVVVVRYRRGCVAVRRPMAGVLIAPAAPLCAADPTNLRQGEFLCMGCDRYSQCWRQVGVPAAEEIEGRPGHSSGGTSPTGLEVDLEQVTRLLESASGLLGRLIELLSLLPTHRMIHSLGRLFWFLPLLCAGKARFH